MFFCLPATTYTHFCHIIIKIIIFNFWTHKFKQKESQMNIINIFFFNGVYYCYVVSRVQTSPVFRLLPILCCLKSIQTRFLLISHCQILRYRYSLIRSFWVLIFCFRPGTYCCISSLSPLWIGLGSRGKGQALSLFFSIL